jgi:thiol-disulfide isomerase/thioredoxin
MMFFGSTRSRALLGFLLLTVSLSSAQQVRTIGKKGLDSLIANRNGKVLMLNIWATWCIPCKEEFPDLVRLSNELKGKNAEIVAVSVDFPDEIKEKVAPFVKKMKTPFRVYVADFASQDEFFASFDKSWSGAIPATFIYDPSGKQKAFLLGKQRHDQLKKAVEDVLVKR